MRSFPVVLRGYARREVDDLTRQKDAVTAQLGQMLSGLAGIVPTMVPPQGGSDKKGERSGDGATKVNL